MENGANEPGVYLPITFAVLVTEFRSESTLSVYSTPSSQEA